MSVAKFGSRERCSAPEHWLDFRLRERSDEQPKFIVFRINIEYCYTLYTTLKITSKLFLSTAVKMFCSHLSTGEYSG